MNRKRFIFTLLIFLCLFPAFLAAREASDIVGDSFEEINGRGLEIRTNPSGVKVFIDGVERGFTPVGFDNLSPGEHSVRLIREGYKERDFKVTLFNTSRLLVSIEMEEERGMVMVSIHRAAGSPVTLPLNPQIYTNSLDETIGPVTASSDNKTLLNLPTGYRTITVRAFGWEDESETVLVSESSAVEADFYMKPAAFSLRNVSQSRKLLNPMNSGSLGATEYRFEVSAPGTGNITITDRNGSVVLKKHFGIFNSWFQSVTWNGRDSFGNPLPEGIYTVMIEASALPEFFQGAAETLSFRLETAIDYSAAIFPLSLESGVSGLTFAPMPHALPAGSYQFEAGFVFGNFRLPFEMPFGISLRIAPFNKFEFAAAFNVNVHLENRTGWSVSGSVKYNIIYSLPFSFAAAVSYAWANESGEPKLGPGGGIGLYAPLSLELSDFSIIFSPAVFWRGTDSPAPTMLISTGALYRGGWFNAGLSMRSEIDFTQNSEGPKFLAGVQGRFYPPPSNLVFSFLAGVWTQNSKAGGFGGVGIGVIY